MRFTIYAILDTFEPFIRIPCRILAAAGILISVLCEFFWRVPDFPFVLMFAISIGFNLVQILYIRLLCFFKDAA